VLSWDYALREIAPGWSIRGGPFARLCSGSGTREITMQASAISNPSPANAPSPAPATLLPFDPQSPSLFASLFQAVLKSAENSLKIPPAGKQQDSSREPAATAGPGSNPIGFFPQGLLAPTIPPVLPESALSVVAAPVPVPLDVPSSAKTTEATASSKPLISKATTDLARDTTPASATIHGATALSNALPLQSVTAFALNLGQASGTAEGSSTLPNPLLLQSTTSVARNTVQARAIVQGPPTLSNPPLSPVRIGLAGSTAPTTVTTQGAADGSNALPLKDVTDFAKDMVRASGSTQGPSAFSSPLFPTTTNDLTPKIDEIKAVPQNTVAATTFPQNFFDSDPASIPPVGVSQDPAPLQWPVTGAMAEQKVSPAEANVPADSTNVLTTFATEQSIPIPPIGDSISIPPGSGLALNQDVTTSPILWTPSQVQSLAAAPPPGPQDVPSNGSNLPNNKTPQTVRTDFSFLNMQTLVPSSAATKVSVTVLPHPAAIPEAQSSLQPLANVSPAPAETLVHAAAKSAAIGASTLKFHESMPARPTNPASQAPVAAAPAKTPSQDLSNGSPSNDSNPKADHASNASSAKTDDKGLIQSLNTAASNPTNGHSAPADSAPAAAAVPVQTQNANSGARPATSSGAEPRPTESLPAASQSGPVVNAAHLVDQPGRTEIRIEMQADSLGGVELRAHIAGDQIGASIAVEHHDAQLALATDLPALHLALSEKNLRVDTLSVSQGTFSSMNGDPGQDTGHRSFPQSPAKFAYVEQQKTPQALMESPTEWAGQSNSSAGLSVVA
jgi:flagellar hook-length control protein FliK